MISRKDFEQGNFKGKETDRWNHSVTVFLRKHYNSAFTVKEIVEKVKVSEDTVRSILRVLEKQEGLVSHKAPYFIWNKSEKKKTEKKKTKKVKKKKPKRK